MIKMKRILSAVLVAGMFSVGNIGCAEKPPAKNEIKVTTPGGTTVTIEKPVKAVDRNPPSVHP
jgi:hypothetical protein